MEEGSRSGRPDARKKVTYDEARNLLDAQQRTLSDIDDKAMRTNRVTVILLGVLVGTARISGTTVFDPILAKVSGAALVGSIAVAAYTYSESSLVLGPNEVYIEQLTANNFTGTTWDDDYLLTMAYWISENEKVIDLNGWLLLGSQALLVLGLILFALSVEL